MANWKKEKSVKGGHQKWEDHGLYCILKYDGFLERNSCVWVATEVDSFHGKPFYWITRVMQTLVFGRHFLQSKQNKPSISRKLTVFVANDKLNFKAKLEFWKICIWFQILKDFSDEIDGDINKCDLHFCYDIMKCVNI